MIDETLETAPASGARDANGSPAGSAPRSSWRRRLRRPAVVDVRLGPLLSMYAWRLRRHGLQELLAGIGIAIGVALVFGVLVSSQSITGSGAGILHAIVGKATLQVSARSPNGFDETLVERIGQLPGVRVAAPVLRVNAVIQGPSGRHQVQLVGSTVSQFDLEGAATRYLGSERLGGTVALTSSLANEIGSAANGRVTLLARGRAERLPVHAVWGSQQIGPLAASSIAVGALSTMQSALSLPRRVTQVYVQPQPGSEDTVRRSLERLAAGHVDVQSAEHELEVLKATTQPTTESSRLFAAIGGIVGFLFAVNAMLLTVPERRRWVAEARMQGYSASQVTVILGFQALVLGVIASAAGVLIGYALSHTLFGALPAVLTLSFPIGNEPTITASAIAIAMGVGLVATFVASAAPLRDLSSRQPIDAVLHGTGKVGHSIGSRTTTVSLVVGVIALLVAGLLVLADSSLGVVSAVLIALGTLCVVPALLVATIRGLAPMSERLRRSMLPIALAEAQGTATRSIALASVAALAVYGSVAVLGTREDLIRGLDTDTSEFFGTANIWVTPAGNNPFLTDSFASTQPQAAISSASGVVSVRPYQGSFLDVGTRRIWIRARPAADREPIQASQLVDGNLDRATALVRAGGWAAVSDGFAKEHHLWLGTAFSLPTPAGAMPLRVAALTTNSGWPPGAITISQRDYERFWQTADASALEVSLAHGVGPTAGNRAVRRALASYPALRVQTRAERESQNSADARQGVQSLSEISRLVLIAAALAIVFALTAAITAHRQDVASRKAEGYETGQMWRVLFLESGVVVGVGAIAGALSGIYGHAVAARWLRLSQDFPAPFSVDPGQLLLTLGVVAGVTLVVVAIAGSIVAATPPRLGESD